MIILESWRIHDFKIREMLGEGMKQSDLTRSVGVSRQIVNRIAREKREENVLQVSLQQRG